MKVSDELLMMMDLLDSDAEFQEIDLLESLEDLEENSSQKNGEAEKDGAK